MLTLETGILTDRLPAGLRQGFTLLETLVVVLLIGILAGIATYSMRSDSAVELEGMRLASLIELAQEEAILNSTEYALVFRPTGYVFYAADETGWQEAAGESIFRLRSLPSATEIRLYLDGDEVVVAGSDSEVIKEGGTPPKPALYILSSGEFTPFEIVLIDRAGRVEHRLTGDPFAGVSMVSRTM